MANQPMYGIVGIPATTLLLIQGQAALAESQHHIPLMPPASHSHQQGFVRIINHSHHAGEVHIHAIDDGGQRFGPVSLRLDAEQAAHFNSTDLELGNPSKGLSGGVGDGTGNWRLELTTGLDIEPLAYIRTSDGFLTSVHDVVELVEDDVPDAEFRYGAWVRTLNPGSNRNQVSELRVINTSDSGAQVLIEGLDDQGEGSSVILQLGLLPRQAYHLTAQQLERDGFGDGAGKWQLYLRSTTEGTQAMSLLRSPTGNLTNLVGTTSPGTRTIPFIPSASNTTQQGFVRIINRSATPTSPTRPI